MQVTRARFMSTLTPKPTSKKTKSRLFLYPSMPRIALGPNALEILPGQQTRVDRRKAALNLTYNHVLRANDELSRRERHWRTCLARAQCVWHPQNPDVSYFVPPYWLKVKQTRVAEVSDYSKQDGVDHSVWWGSVDPTVQTVLNSRLVSAFKALTDASLKSKLIHAKVITEADIEQVRDIQKRGYEYWQNNKCLFDRVIEEAERELEQARQSITADSVIDTEVVSEVIPAELTDLMGKSDIVDIGNAALSEQTLVRPSSETDRRQSLIRLAAVLNSSHAEQRKWIKARIVSAFGRHPTDQGTARVQSALLTLKIRDVANHLVQAPQDTPSRIKLDHLTQRRRVLMDFLKRKNFTEFMQTVSDLGLKMA